MPPNRWPDGPLPSETPYADLPIASSHCMNDSCTAFSAGWNESYRETSLISQVDYGFWTLCYYLSWGVLFTLAHLIYLLRDHYGLRVLSKDTLTHRNSWNHSVVALYRSVAYRRFTGRRLRALPSFGILALFSLSTIFFACLIFPEQPYIRSHFRFGSPPLSVRCAMTIMALMPLLIALGGKINIVTLLTGVCYTKLNIFHRYVGGLVFALSTVHMIPHLYAPIKDGGFNYLAQLYIDQKRELSGTILYFLFLCLTALSIPCIRRAFYELFAHTHILLGFAFLGLLGWHINGEHASPVYLYATLAILVLQSLLRLLLLPHHSLLHHRAAAAAGGYPTTLEPLPGALTRVRVTVPPTLRWRPGAHAYLRLPALSLLDNHPFTIASVPRAMAAARPHSTSTSTSTNELVFLVRTHAGFTARLAALASSSVCSSPLASPPPPQAAGDRRRGGRRASTSSSSSSSGSSTHPPPPPIPLVRTLVDGPHALGSYAPALHVIADAVVLVAAGTGITATLPWAVGLSERMMAWGEAEEVGRRRRAEGTRHCRVRVVRLVWVVRRVEWVGWVRSEVEEVVGKMREAGNEGGAGGRRVVVDVYVTGGRAKEEDGGESKGEVDVGEGAKRLEAGLGGSGGGMESGDEIPITPPPVYRADPCGSEEARIGALEEGLGTAEEEERQSGLYVHYERPVLAQLLPSLMSGRRAYVLGCGPEGFKAELSNAVAGLQTEMVVRSKRMESIALHTETFGW